MLNQIHLYKMPRLKRVNPFFFQCFLEIVGADVPNVVRTVLDGHPMPPKRSCTFVALTL